MRQVKHIKGAVVHLQEINDNTHCTVFISGTLVYQDTVPSWFLEDELKHINKSIPILKRELECEKYLEALDMVLENTPFSRKKQETFLN